MKKSYILNLFSTSFLVLTLGIVTYSAQNLDIKRLVGSKAAIVSDEPCKICSGTTCGANPYAGSACNSQLNDCSSNADCGGSGPSTGGKNTCTGKETSCMDKCTCKGTSTTKCKNQCAQGGSASQQDNSPKNPPPVSKKTCDANGAQYPVGSVVIGGDSKVSQFSKCTADGWRSCPEPECSILDLASVPDYKKDEYNKAVADEKARILALNQAAEAAYEKAVKNTVTGAPDISTGIFAKPTTPPTYLSSSCNNSCKAGESCVQLYYGYYGCQTTSSITTKIGATRCDGSNLLTFTGTSWNKSYCSGGCNVIGNIAQCGQPIFTDPTKIIAQIVTMCSGAYKVTKQADRVISQTYCPTGCDPKTISCNGKQCFTDKDCGENNMCVLVSSSSSQCMVKFKTSEEETFADRNSCQNKCLASGNTTIVCTNQCQQYAVKQEHLEDFRAGANTVTFGAFNNYVATYQQINRETKLTDPNYNPSFKALFSGDESYWNAVGDERGIEASKQLGTIVTLELATIPTGAIMGGGGIVGVLTAAGVVSTGTQGATALLDCTILSENGLKDERCQQESARFAISLITLGTSDLIRGTSGVFTWAAQKLSLSSKFAPIANTVMTGANFSIDGYDTYDTCAGGNKSTSGCAMSAFAVVADVGGAGIDYKQNELFLGPSTKTLNVPPKVEIPTGAKIPDVPRSPNAPQSPSLSGLDTPDTPTANILAAVPPAKPSIAQNLRPNITPLDQPKKGIGEAVAAMTDPIFAKVKTAWNDIVESFSSPLKPSDGEFAPKVAAEPHAVGEVPAAKSNIEDISVKIKRNETAIRNNEFKPIGEFVEKINYPEVKSKQIADTAGHRDINGTVSVEFTDIEVNRITTNTYELTKQMVIPKTGNVSDVSEIIASINNSLADPLTSLGKEQRNLLNIFYSLDQKTGNLPDKINSFITDGGNPEKLPQLFADLITENLARYKTYQTFWEPVLREYNAQFLPLMNQSLPPGAEKFRPIDPESVFWSSYEKYSGDNTKYLTPAVSTGASMQNRQTNYVTLPVSDGITQSYKATDTLFGKEIEVILFKPIDGTTKSSIRDSKFDQLIHESIHANIVNQYGVGNTIPDNKTIIQITEGLTDLAAAKIGSSLQNEFSNLYNGFKNNQYVFEKNIISKVFGETLGIKPDVIFDFGLKQDPIGFIKYSDNVYNNLDETAYKNFIETLYQNLMIGPSQRDFVISNKPPSMADIYQMSNVWVNANSVLGNPVNNINAAKIWDGRLGLGYPDGTFDSVDSYARQIEISKDLTDTAGYLPKTYFSKTSDGQDLLNFKPPFYDNQSLKLKLPTSPTLDFFKSAGKAITNFVDTYIAKPILKLFDGKSKLNDGTDFGNDALLVSGGVLTNHQ